MVNEGWRRQREGAGSAGLFTAKARGRGGTQRFFVGGFSLSVDVFDCSVHYLIWV